MQSICNIILTSSLLILSFFLEKGKARRQGVSQKSHKNVKTFRMQFIKEDKSEGKAVSHLRLNSELTNNKNFLVEMFFTKKDLLLLCKAQISITETLNLSITSSASPWDQKMY
jgi:hypothetical protein